ncbi:MAG: hypothetical protein K9M11_04065 [Candidatus Pacebacteria bacterium]|nr:hypothetical protein [Candidatus Paceibacterota bacterium]
MKYISNIHKKNWIILALGVALCVCFISLAYIYIVHNREANRVGGANADGVEKTAPYVVPPLTKNYTSSAYGFSLNIPEDFTTRESDVNGTHTIVFENSKSEGVQIVVSPYDEKGVKVLTKDMVQSAIPDLKITDDQVLEIGKSYKGLAFKSDNGAFNGDSREVWFIYKDNLYQISTYSRFDDLLKGMFATWEFK